MQSPIDDEILQRYYDGDLPPAEARALAARIAREPAAQRRLRELEALSTLVREASAAPLTALDSDALFRAIEARLPQRAAPSIAPPPPAVRPIGRRRSVWFPALAATAVAAATLLVVLRSGEHDGGAGEAIPQVAAKIQALNERRDEPDVGSDVTRGQAPDHAALVTTPQGSRLERVDFGSNTGTAFAIEGEDVGVTVIWLIDEGAP